MSGQITKQPRNAVATFTDAYGDERIIHRPKGRRLSVFGGCDTPTIRLNRAVAILFGANVKSRRKTLGLTARQVVMRAGFVDVNPKQRMFAIENATRAEGVRFGTLYALAHALQCEPCDLIPKLSEAMVLARVEPEAGTTGLIAAP